MCAKKSRGTGRLARVSRRTEPAATNAFELAARNKGGKRKFPLLGQKDAPVKQKKAGQQEGTWKKSLLIEYKKMKKSNRFVDKRFGEHDAELTEEDRALERLKRKRMQDLGGRFVLANEPEQLMHLGKVLNEDDDAEEGSAFRGDDDSDLDEETVKQLHFGGGTEPEGSDRRNAFKTKKEVMEEIMAKSKAAKAQKAQQKEDDLSLQEELDSAFQSVMQGNLLYMGKSETGQTALPNSAVDSEYDKAQKSLVFDARAQAGDRLRTEEEVAAMEAERLSQLERERIRRMHALEPEEEDALDVGAGEKDGGFAGRRKRQRLQDSGPGGGQQTHQSGDAEDDFELDELEDEEEEGSEEEESDEEREAQTKLDARRQKRAAGDDDLQKSFRMQSAELLKKYNIAPSGKTAEELAEMASSSEDGSEGEDDEESEEDGGVSGGESEEEEEEPIEEDARAVRQDNKPSKHNDVKEAKSGGGELDSPEQPDTRPAGNKREKLVELQGPLDVPFTLKAPASYEEFAKLVENRTAEDFDSIVQRIRANNALSLSQDNRRKLQVFYGILVQHFVIVAGQHPVPLELLDAITKHVQNMTQEVPFYAATVARARIMKILRRLSSERATIQSWGNSVVTVPMLMFMKLLSRIFPVTDARHPVLTSASLLLGAALVQIPESAPQAVTWLRGLFLAQLAIQMCKPADRLAPEAFEYCCRLLMEMVESRGSIHLQRGALSATPRSLSLKCDLSRPYDDAWFSSDEFGSMLLASTLDTIKLGASMLSDCPAAAELLARARAAVDGVTLRASSEETDIAEPLRCRLEECAEVIASVSNACVSKRRPLLHSTKVKPPTVKTFNPKFENEFAKGRDYDPDRAKVEERQLKKELSREKRATMRELRKEAGTLATIRDKEKQEAGDARHEKAMQAISWLQSFEADMKSGGQRGMHKSKKRK